MTENTIGRLALVTAGALSLTIAAAQAQEGATFRPSPGVMSLSTLGNSDLLQPLLSEDTFATQSARMGDNRVTDGFAGSLPSFVPKPRFRDVNVAAIGGISIAKEIPVANGAAFVRLAGAGSFSFGSDATPLNNTVRDQRIALQGFYAPTPGLLLGVGATYDHLYVVSDTTQDPLGSYSTQERPTAGLQLFYAQTFGEYVGVAVKSELQRGTTTFKNNLYLAPGAPPLQFGNTQADYRYYFEGNLVGTLSAQNTPWMVPGYVAHPILTATYQRNGVNATYDTLGRYAPGPAGPREYFGLISPVIRFEKAQLPSPQLQIMPSLLLGYEHVYRDSMAIYFRERNFGVAGAGVGFTMYGQRVDVDYKIRQGFTDRRRYQGVSLTTSLFF